MSNKLYKHFMNATNIEQEVESKLEKNILKRFYEIVGINNKQKILASVHLNKKEVHIIDLDCETILLSITFDFSLDDDKLYFKKIRNEGCYLFYDYDIMKKIMDVTYNTLNERESEKSG